MRDKFNKYGFVSGGYIADLMDRLALRKINESFPETKDQQIYTASARITYHKQLCDTVGVASDTGCTQLDSATYLASCDLYDHNGVMIASGEFDFVKATHNFCSDFADTPREKPTLRRIK